MRQIFLEKLERMSLILLYCGGIVILIQAIWISYGVFMRYVMNNPDGMVTEATALMLMPVAFFGLAYALSRDAYPKVTMLRDRLPQQWQMIIDKFNMLVMALTGLFFTVATCGAALRAFYSGAASEILLWPKFYFWFPVGISWLFFSLLALALLLKGKPKANQDSSAQEPP